MEVRMCNGNIRVLIFILNFFTSVILALVIIDRVFPKERERTGPTNPSYQFWLMVVFIIVLTVLSGLEDYFLGCQLLPDIIGGE